MEPSEAFDLGLAQRCAGACALAYRESTIDSELAHARTVPVLTSSGEQTTLIAFKGTGSLRDWLTNLKVDFVDLGICKVHAGFWRAAQSLIGQVLTLAQTSNPAPVIVTGHSLGAALAIETARLLVRLGRPVEAVYTFGGPRVGNAGFAALYNEVLKDKTFRVVHEEDIVPRLPFWHWGYRHVGHEAYLPATGSRIVMDPKLPVQLALDAVGLWSDWRNGNLGSAFTDHRIEQYQGHLATLNNQEWIK